MVILLSWTNTEAAPPETSRYVFLAAVTVPLLFNRTPLIIAIITVFYTVSYYGYAFGYMPQTIEVYVVILIACLILSGQTKSYKGMTGWLSFILFGMYAIIINTITSFEPLIAVGGKTIFCCLFPFYFSTNKREGVKILEQSFIILSIIMSIQYLIIGDQAILVYDQDGSGLTRTGWTDPNHFASIIGLGIVISVMLLMDLKERTLFSIIYYGMAIILSVIVVLLNASRGASLALALSVIMMTFMSKVEKKYKFLIILFIVLALIVLHQFGFFGLLEVRLATTDNTGTGRTLIWATKLDAFLNSGNPLSLLFGVGFEEGLVLGTGYSRSFHNDVICAFVDYGFIGLLLFLIMFAMPVVKAPRKKRPIILSLITYLFVVGFSLCPLTEGFLPYYVFLFYIFAKMQVFREQDYLDRL